MMCKEGGAHCWYAGTLCEYETECTVGVAQLESVPPVGDGAAVDEIEPAMPEFMPVGESDAYCWLSGSGALVPSVGIVSFENTPACENG